MFISLSFLILLGLIFLNTLLVHHDLEVDVGLTTTEVFSFSALMKALELYLNTYSQFI